MRSVRRALAAVAAAAIAAAAASSGCGSTFAKASAITTLRVLAVQKDRPYAPPGATVNLKMLWWDGKSPVDGPKRPVSVAWFGGCEDPAGDLYYGCFAQIGEKLAAYAAQGGAPSGAAGTYVGLGDRFSWTLASDIISRRPPTPGAVAPYGLSYVFFAACAGKLAPAAPRDDAPFPLPVACLDDAGNPLGSEDFVPGYSAIYSYEQIENHNPTLSAFGFDGAPLPVAEADAPHVPRCAASDCPTHTLQIELDPSNAEDDPGATTPDGAPLKEQLWVDYYATAGDLSKGTRLVNDATAGWNDDRATEWTVPSEPGPVVVWAVVHDNRGGVEWMQRRIVVD